MRQRVRSRRCRDKRRHMQLLQRINNGKLGHQIFMRNGQFNVVFFIRYDARRRNFAA